MTPWSSQLRVDLRAILMRYEQDFVPPLIAWQGRKFLPPTGEPWMRESLRPTGSALRTVGAKDGLISEMWLYLVDLFWPRNNELAGIENATDVLCSRFRPGTAINTARGGYIQACQRAAIVEEPAWMMSSITVQGWVYRPND